LGHSWQIHRTLLPFFHFLSFSFLLPSHTGGKLLHRSLVLPQPLAKFMSYYLSSLVIAGTAGPENVIFSTTITVHLQSHRLTDYILHTVHCVTLLTFDSMNSFNFHDSWPPAGSSWSTSSSHSWTQPPQALCHFNTNSDSTKLTSFYN
jgi:hypothetical protein